MPLSKMILSAGLTVMLAALATAAVRKSYEPPADQTAREELARLQKQRYQEWIPPEQ